MIFTEETYFETTNKDEAAFKKNLHENMMSWKEKQECYVWEWANKLPKGELDRLYTRYLVEKEET